MEKRNEMLQNVLLDKDRIFDLKLFWFEMICSQLSDRNIKQIWLLELPSKLAEWEGGYFWTIYFSLRGVVFVLIRPADQQTNIYLANNPPAASAWAW